MSGGYTLVSESAAELLAQPVPEASRPQLQRVLQADGVKLVRLALAAGQAMREHSTNAPLIVHVLAGEVAFRIDGDELRMPAGAIVHVDSGVLHEVAAVEASHLLLTICA